MRFPFFKALGGSIAAIVGIMTAFWIGYQMGFSKADNNGVGARHETK
jgi:hypothetical protein